MSSRYKIITQVGQGQFGRVFQAVDQETGETVALKDLDQIGYSTKNFLREISCLVSLRHPNIVSFQGIEHHKTGRYLVMDYCDGGTLRQLMESETELDIQISLQFVLDILAGLAYVHKQGIVHCDIKPENILLKLEGQKLIAKISDFGISRLIAEADIIRQSGGYTGSPAYMAPERFYGRFSPASDLYAVGILLYELIVKERPFSGLPAELLTAHLSKSVKMPAIIPLPLQSVIDTALRKLPQRRFSSAEAMSKALQKAMQELSL
jgi:serine/threonine protein kinase